jgi:uncharacterized protein
MIVEVDRIPREGLSVSRDFEFSSLDLIDENTVFLSPARADVVIRKIGDEVMIKGTLTARLSFVCSRCLSPYDYPVDASFDLVFLPEDLDTIKDELDEDDIDRTFYRHRRLDLREIILEQLNLTIPLKPLCSETCEGICAVCGKLRQEGRCSCLVQEPEPTLLKLKNFVRDKS